MSLARLLGAEVDSNERDESYGASQLDALVAAHRHKQVLSFDVGDTDLTTELQKIHDVANVLERLERNGKNVSVWFRTTEGVQKTVTVSPADAIALYRAGMTIYCEVPDGFLKDVCVELAELLDEDASRAKPWLFLSRKGAVTPLHFDGGDGLTVQILGRKRWSISKLVQLRHPPRNWAPGQEWHADLAVLDGRGPRGPASPADMIDVDLVPGKCVFVPAGAWHEVECLEDSVSVDLNLTPATSRWCDVFEEIVRAMLLRTTSARKHWAFGGQRSAEEAIEEGDRILEALRTDLARLRTSELLGEARPPMGHGPWAWNPAAVLRLKTDERGRGMVEVEVRGFYEETGSFALPVAALAKMEILQAQTTLSEELIRQVMGDSSGNTSARDIVVALYRLQAIQTI